jgi:glucose/arabinose dehydrogenase
MKAVSRFFLILGTISIGVLVSNAIIFPLQIDRMLIVAYAQNIGNKTVAREAEIPGALFAHNLGVPTLNDSKLKVQTIFKGLQLPTTMAFLGPNDILVLEKEKGTVDRIVNGNLIAKPLLKVNVASEVERGMLGIAISKNENANAHPFVFLYFTEKLTGSGSENTKNVEKDIEEHSEIANRVYRYEFVNGMLVNPKLLLDLPGTPGPRHNGGAIIIGPDNNLYIPIGDLDGHNTEAQNVEDGGPPDGTGGILRITQDGKPVGEGIIGQSSPANKYFAYGIRNSFGLDFDPVTGKLWDTENGPSYGDEINLVEPGFNGGWLQVQGKAPPDFDQSKLVDFGGKGKYRDPEFSWFNPVGPTKILFLNSIKLGEQYQNDVFVSNIHNGTIYHFKLNTDRTAFVLKGPLADKVADTDNENKGIVFGSNFAGISDMVVGPDGYMYVVSLGRGIIYRIVPVSTPSTPYLNVQ